MLTSAWLWNLLRLCEVFIFSWYYTFFRSHSLLHHWWCIWWNVFDCDTHSSNGTVLLWEATLQSKEENNKYVHNHSAVNLSYTHIHRHKFVREWIILMSYDATLILYSYQQQWQPCIQCFWRYWQRIYVSVTSECGNHHIPNPSSRILNYCYYYVIISPAIMLAEFFWWPLPNV